MQTLRDGADALDNLRFDELDELEALLNEAPAAKAVDPLEELDALLDESTAIASAKRAQRQGRKLTVEQVKVLEAADFGRAVATWEPVETVAHFTQFKCACGASGRQFASWYTLLKHRGNSSTKLVRSDRPEASLSKQSRYTSHESVEYCTHCLGTLGEADLPIADTLLNPIIESLGAPHAKA